MPSDILTLTQEQLDELTSLYPAVFKRTVAKENYNIISFDHVRGGHAAWCRPAGDCGPYVRRDPRDQTARSQASLRTWTVSPDARSTLVEVLQNPDIVNVLTLELVMERYGRTAGRQDD